MPVGQVRSWSFTTTPDPASGALVERLTPPDANYWYPYFNQELFAAGHLLVHSDVSGSPQAHWLDLGSGELVQLTDVEGGVGRHDSTLLPGRGQVAYWHGRELCRVDLATGHSEAIFEVPAGFGPSILSPTSDGTSVTFSVCEQLVTSTAVAGQQYSDFYERLYRRPTSMIYRVDTVSGAPRVVWGEREWISHVIVSPTDPDVVVFCHEGPWEQVQRLWRVRVSNGECLPLIDHGRLVSRSGHEFFNRRGELVVQYSQRMTATSRDWVHYHCVTDPDGRTPRFWRMPWGMPTHIQQGDNQRLLVGDGCYPAADTREGGQWIGVFHLRDDDRCDAVPVCRHDSTWKDQPSHPHPVVAPDDQYLYFNTDRGGFNGIYRVPLPA